MSERSGDGAEDGPRDGKALVSLASDDEVQLAVVERIAQSMAQMAAIQADAKVVENQVNLEAYKEGS